MADKSNKTHILQVNYLDDRGGAAIIAMSLARALIKKGMSCFFAAGIKSSPEAFVLEIPTQSLSNHPLARWLWSLRAQSKKYDGKIRGVWRLRRWIRAYCRPEGEREKALGHEDFNFPLSRQILSLPPKPPQIVHLHNLHNDYFDLSYLPELSQKVKVLLTLHDAWLMSGHCAHSFKCERWKTGCGLCPDLTIYPPLTRDGTAFNWERKRDIFLRSKLYLASPSQWLADRAAQSILAPAIRNLRVIPNGIDINSWQPYSKAAARDELGLSHDAFILLFAADEVKANIFKDFETLLSAVRETAGRIKNSAVQFIALGDSRSSRQIVGDNTQINFVAYHKQHQKIARYYQAADVYIHAANADNFPNTILEAMACGTPVVATRVGGIPEQIMDGETGFLTAPHNAPEIADAVEKLYHSQGLLEDMGKAATKHVKNCFSLERMTDAYLNYYEDILGIKE